MASLEGPPARKYRSRKEKPCDSCRRRRVCCVRDAEGDCALCSRRSIPCTFSSEPSPRKRRAGSVPQTRESRQPRNPTQIEQNTPNGNAQVEVQDQRVGGGEGKYIGLSGTDDVYFVVQRDQAIGNDPAREAYFRDRDGSSSAARSESSNHRARSVEPDNSLVQSIFFESAHPAFPLLDESRARNGSQSRLLTIAIAIISKYTSPELEGLHINSLIEEFSACLLLEARSPTLETVEAAILFTQRALRGKMGTSAPGIWAMIGTIVGICHDLGLNIDCSTWSIAETVKKRRRRIWWAMYMQDKWFAMALGRPSYISDKNTTALMLTVSDFEPSPTESDRNSAQSTELITGKHCFAAMAALTVILDEVLSIFFTISSVVNLRKVTGEHIIEIFDRIDQRLDIWQSTYLDQILVQRFFPDVTGSLELAFITVRIMLLRGVFPKLYRRNIHLDTHVDRAVEATTRVINLVETLQINRLSAFWWSCSGLNLALAGTFMASLKRLSADPIRVSYWDSRLKHYRRVLSAYGATFWPAKFASAALDVMAKSLTKIGHINTTNNTNASAVSSAERQHSISEGVSNGITAAATTDNASTSEGGFDLFTSPSTPWSGVSYDFFPHNLTSLNEFDFNTDWWGAASAGPLDGGQRQLGLADIPE